MDLPRLKLPRIPKRPSLRLVQEMMERHSGLVAGVDEAGRGPLAGPVVAAAVIFDPKGKRPRGLGDSKQLTADQREALFPRIQRDAVAFGVGVASAQEIDTLNILGATRLAVARAIAQLAVAPVAFVTDCLTLPAESRPVLPVVKGDAICSAVAAASILAKVTRDRLMDGYAEEFPEFGWTRNRGYPTPDHYDALGRHGATVLHRMTFAGVGFFDQEVRRSPTHSRLLTALLAAEASGDPTGRHAVAAELDAVAHRLPPPDVEDLRARLGGPTSSPGASPPCNSLPPSTSC